MDLNPAQVRTVGEVARHGSFSRAAESLHLSQPAVSLHMRQLEARCGTALLERVGKRAFPTPAGTLLLEHAGRAFAELEAAQEALRQLRGGVAGRRPPRPPPPPPIPPPPPPPPPLPPPPPP